MEEITTPKRVKGSAIVSETGDFIFTPYQTHSEEEKSMKCLFIDGNCTLWKSKNAYSIRLKVPFKGLPTLAKVVSSLMTCYNKMKNDHLEGLEKALKEKKTPLKGEKTPLKEKKTPSKKKKSALDEVL